MWPISQGEHRTGAKRDLAKESKEKLPGAQRGLKFLFEKRLTEMLDDLFYQSTQSPTVLGTASDAGDTNMMEILFTFRDSGQETFHVHA